jgi:hypothetical protein
LVKEPVHVRLERPILAPPLPDMDIKPTPEEPPHVGMPATTGWITIMSEGFEYIFPSGDWEVFDGNGSEHGIYYWDDDNYKSYVGKWSGWCANACSDPNNTNCQSNTLDPEDNDYPNYTASWMIYGPFSLQDADDAELKFCYWLDSETNYDWFMVLASIDDVRFYGYQYSGHPKQWAYETLDLTNVPWLGDLAGEPAVWIAFLFTSDYSITYKGAFIDDIVLRKHVPPPTPTPTPTRTPTPTHTPTPTPTPTPGPVRIYGYVTYEDGGVRQPAADAYVDLRQGGTYIATTKTQANGYYQFPPMQLPGRHDVYIRIRLENEHHWVGS